MTTTETPPVLAIFCAAEHPTTGYGSRCGCGRAKPCRHCPEEAG